DELKRLMKEFEKELAILKGRVDGLEARVGELEATQFSTTTKLKSKATFVIGGVNASGDSQSGIPFNKSGKGGADAYNKEFGALTFNYNYDLFLDTSFTGKDLLRTKLRAGNFNNSVFSGNNGVNLTGLNIAFGSDDIIKVDRLFYKFPVGNSFTFIAGAKARNTESLAMWPSVYTKGGAAILDYYAVAGVPGVYNKATGQLIGAYWKQKVDKGRPNLSVSVNYVTGNKEGNNSNPSEGGFMTDNSAASLLAQLGWGNGQYGVAAAYRYGQCNSNFRKVTSFVQNDKSNLGCKSKDLRNERSSNSYALNAYWQPKDSGFIPSVSIGWSINTINGKRIVDGTYTNSQSWFTGLKWDDAFMDGNALGFAVGQPTFATALEGGDTPFDGNYVFELYYNFQVTDNIAVTPALFYLSRPMGQNTQNLKANGTGYDGQFNVFGGLIQTTFTF
ncbi:MAG: porin, partial [Synechococcus sp. NP17]|nr:porin [Synechococcus sp. NP17]